ncbi:MAG TPA: ABC transporter permease, partial [Clostridia bacterium]|nr:ABC transporter permease [Clostridia bacterium]
MNDLRFALRMLFKNPGFTATVVLALALGIGLNSALFTVVYNVLLAPLPYPDANRIVQVQSVFSTPGKPTESLSVWAYPRFNLVREHQRVFDHVAAYSSSTFNVTTSGETERIEAEMVSAAYFPLLGVQPRLGRMFLPEEDQSTGAQPVVVISEGLWQRRFGGDPAIVGRSLEANRTALTIVGVAPAGFRGQSGAADMWVPITLAPVFSGDPQRLKRSGAMWHRVIAKLNSSVTPDAALAGLRVAERQIESVLPPANKATTWNIRLVPLKEAVTDPTLRRSLWVLAAAVGFVLLVACVNVASLFLARTLSREREFAVRLALGASSARLMCQLLMESLVLAIVAGGFALLLASWGIHLIAAFQPTPGADPFSEYVQLPDFGTLSLGVPVLLFNFALALGCGVAFGFMGARYAARGSLNQSQHGAPALSMGLGRNLGLGGTRGLLVVAQTALALWLLIGAGLMVRSFARLISAPIGFDPSHLLTLRLDQPVGTKEAEA